MTLNNIKFYFLRNQEFVAFTILNQNPLWQKKKKDDKPLDFKYGKYTIVSDGPIDFIRKKRDDDIFEDEYKICLRGDSGPNSAIVAKKFDSAEEAKKFIKGAVEALQKWDDYVEENYTFNLNDYEFI